MTYRMAKQLVSPGDVAFVPAGGRIHRAVVQGIYRDHIEDRYRENIAFVKLQIGDKDADGLRNPTYMMAVSHGAGGGILTGGAVNRNERFGYVLDGVDCLITGHTHKPYVTQPAKIVVDGHNNKVSLKPFKVVSASAWLDYGGYAAQKMLLPSSHASQVITLAGNKKEIKVTM